MDYQIYTISFQVFHGFIWHWCHLPLSFVCSYLFYVFTYLFPIYYLFIEANNWGFDSNNIHDYYDFNLVLVIYFKPTPTHPPLISGRTSSLFIL